MPEKSARARPAILPASAPLAEQVLGLIASGTAVSRTDLAEQLGVAPSTISLTVAQLVADGLVTEEGTRASTGGRPRKILRLGGTDEYTVAADLGGSHARVGVVLPGGEITDVATIAFDMSQGPEHGLATLAEHIDALAKERSSGTLRSVGLALPGPVDVATGQVNSPSRMPGWHGFPVRDWIEQRLGVPAAVDNDANLMAIGEHTAHSPEQQQSIIVKAGTAIGAGIIVNGTLYRGATGAAGDITHVRIDAAGDTSCSCGNTGCLETVASGAALVRILREQGVDVTSTIDVVERATEAHPQVTNAVRRAGRYLGEVLSANVNFFNPDAVYLAGILSTLEPFVAAVRSQLYESCHPLVTQQLTIERAVLGADAGLVGAGLIAMQRALTVALDRVQTAPTQRPTRTHASR